MQGRGNGTLDTSRYCSRKCLRSARGQSTLSPCWTSLSPGQGDQERHHSGCQNTPLLDRTHARSFAALRMTSEGRMTNQRLRMTGKRDSQTPYAIIVGTLDYYNE